MNTYSHSLCYTIVKKYTLLIQQLYLPHCFCNYGYQAIKKVVKVWKKNQENQKICSGELIILLIISKSSMKLEPCVVYQKVTIIDFDKGQGHL